MKYLSESGLKIVAEKINGKIAEPAQEGTEGQVLMTDGGGQSLLV